MSDWMWNMFWHLHSFISLADKVEGGGEVEGRWRWSWWIKHCTLIKLLSVGRFHDWNIAEKQMQWNCRAFMVLQCREILLFFYLFGHSTQTHIPRNWELVFNGEALELPEIVMQQKVIQMVRLFTLISLRNALSGWPDQRYSVRITRTRIMNEMSHFM